MVANSLIRLNKNICKENKMERNLSFMDKKAKSIEKMLIRKCKMEGFN